MTDKIIIDCVDVSECFLYSDKICIRTKSKCNAICDYAAYVLRRHLIRKEQECERLKAEMSVYGATGICEVCTEKSVLELDQLKKKHQKAKKIIKEAINDFSLEVGTPYYDKLITNAKEIGIKNDD